MPTTNGQKTINGQVQGQQTFDPANIAKVLDAVNDLQMGVTTAAVMRAMIQGQPCEAAAFLREQYAMGISLRNDTLNFDGAKAAEFLPLSISDSVRNQGRPGFGYMGGKPLALFAVEQLGINRLFRAGPLRNGAYFAGPFVPLYVEPYLPSGAEMVDGSWTQRMSNSGTKMSSGVYMTAGGKLRGSAIRAMIVQWMSHQATKVWPATVPFPRTKLVEIYGTWRGSSRWGTYMIGDPPRAGSKVANANLLIDSMWSAINDADAACVIRWGVESAGIAGQTQAQLDAAAALTATERGETMRKNLLVAGGLALGAFLATR